MSNREWDATQTAVLDAVIACANESGFRSLTTRRVAEVAGVNEVTIFRRFGSKAQLIAAAFEREASEIGAQVGEYTGDLHADLERIVAAIWNAAGRRRLTIPVILSELATNEELRAAAGHSMNMVGKVAAILARYQNDGLLVKEPPLLAHASLVGPLVFLGIVSRLLPEPPAVDIADHVRRFLEGHATGPLKKEK
ncbi:TetR/AcrR family transcriptional regulator [Allorhizocola rhizosphaerae]|uniref:TetR/AcrR family transcriptional regulator n=1 Tax=Allorhizocola rhizosphaerae TaxID=1872709 RepID=UPI000E3EC3C3|nr:TetR/AcrR family transcriptional regulator [Allorhizocola rhizosphaerae]